MKNKIALLVLILSLFGCTSETQFGKCIGLAREGEDPNLIYQVSAKNVILGVILIETIFVPVIIVLDEIYCPVGHKQPEP